MCFWCDMSALPVYIGHLYRLPKPIDIVVYPCTIWQREAVVQCQLVVLSVVPFTVVLIVPFFVLLPLYTSYTLNPRSVYLYPHTLFSLSLSLSLSFFSLFSFLSLYFSCAFSIFLRLGADYSICDSKWHTTTLSFIFFLPFYTKKSKALNDHEHAVLPCGIGEKFKRPSISFAFFALRLFSHLYNTAPSLFVRFLENFSVPLFACGLKRNFIYTRHAEALVILSTKQNLTGTDVLKCWMASITRQLAWETPPCKKKWKTKYANGSMRCAFTPTL